MSAMQPRVSKFWSVVAIAAVAVLTFSCAVLASVPVPWLGWPPD